MNCHPELYLPPLFLLALTLTGPPSLSIETCWFFLLHNFVTDNLVRMKSYPMHHQAIIPHSRYSPRRHIPYRDLDLVSLAGFGWRGQAACIGYTLRLTNRCRYGQRDEIFITFLESAATYIVKELDFKNACILFPPRALCIQTRTHGGGRPLPLSHSCGAAAATLGKVRGKRCHFLSLSLLSEALLLLGTLVIVPHL